MNIRRALWLAGLVWSLYRRSARARSRRRAARTALRRAERSI